MWIQRSIRYNKDVKDLYNARKRVIKLYNNYGKIVPECICIKQNMEKVLKY